MFAWLPTLFSSKKDSSGDFASVASHELRTPLSIIKWYTEILLDEDAGALNDTQKKYIKVIEASNERAIALVTALLNVSRLELDTFSVSPESLSMKDFLIEILNSFTKEAFKKNLSIHSNIEISDDVVLFADRGLLTILFRELLKNAIAFSQTSGVVTVSVSSVNNQLVYTVSDKGIGIKDNEKGYIFSKLFRGTNTTDDTRGSGLGLYIVKTILDKVGGSIIFDTQENNGSTFSIMLPLSGMKKKEGRTRLDI